MVSRLLGGIEPMPVKNDTYFRHLKAGEKDYKRSDSGGLFMLVTKTGSKLWRYAYNFDSKQKLLALGQYPITSLADARIKRDDAKKLYSQSSGLAAFLLNGADGRYREPMVRYLQAVYTRHDNDQTLAEVTGTSYPELDKAYRRFMQSLP